ncbi:hypothetical protein Lesp02_34290 [Lentzea sp. NBRC 105346]|uniref:serine hydrolase domain-containing protein n=1 Tax=Lentzea sp. NBRC 105346 TaxID=3032205 RepID=UPI0024A3E750|nr:serine hydrolase domain-containing protein [Lentzea sp. NBRC 105346]GLZ31241.1 hypothetical protein Lesp02_34290 [Lentzea sp. NBRC 105346]
MSAQSRQFPDRPSLRHLKVEAKRRLAAGEFDTLHDTQLAIAREHGFPSWTALKEHVEGHALAQVRWMLSRFATADSPEWTVPDAGELRRHFADDYLDLLPPDRLPGLFGALAPQLRAGLTEVRAEPLRLRAKIAGLRVEAATEAEPPHRLRTLRLYPLETKAADPRVAAPPRRTSGAVPEEAAVVAAESFAELGLVGLTVAGATADGSAWAISRGWANLDRAEVLLPEHRFPAFAVTKLVTATAVLRLVADGRVRLDEPVDSHGAVTVRELLAHTGGVDGKRGTFAYGHSGYEVLGRLIADVTALPYPQAVTRMVLDPLGMAGSSFPTSPPTTGAATGHRLTEAGSFEPVPAEVSTLTAAAGLWTTALDLVRFGLGWSSLLPAPLVHEALSPQAERDEFGGRAGLGWMLVPARDVAGHPGAGAGFSASVIVRGQPWVVVTNRQVLVEAVNERLAF